MASIRRAVAPFTTTRSWIGLVLIVAGEGLILARHRPASDYYFPLVWLGYVLVLDSGIAAATGQSLWEGRRRIFYAMLPLSAAFWWLFELFNDAVHNWRYVGAESYVGLGFILFATLDFSFVLLAVWSSAAAISVLLPQRRRAFPRRHVPSAILLGSAIAGLVSICLAVMLPRYFFGALWLCLFLLLDPINAWLGRPSMIRAAWERHWQLPLSFALGSLQCGFFWEAWNYWSMPRWVYTIPFVNSLHVFEMPLLGWSGYLPFGLELYAMTNFVLPLLGLGTLTLGRAPARIEAAAEKRAS